MDSTKLNGTLNRLDEETAEELESDIRRTRDEMDRTWRVLQQRLKPRVLVKRASERIAARVMRRVRIKNRVARKVLHSLAPAATRMKQNPLPLAAMAVGLVLLLRRRRKKNQGQPVP